MQDAAGYVRMLEGLLERFVQLDRYLREKQLDAYAELLVRQERDAALERYRLQCLSIIGMATMEGIGIGREALLQEQAEQKPRRKRKA